MALAPYSNPGTLRDFYAMPHDQRVAYQNANPGGVQALMTTNPNNLQLQGLGPGGALDTSRYNAAQNTLANIGGGTPGMNVNTMTSTNPMGGGGLMMSGQRPTLGATRPQGADAWAQMYANSPVYGAGYAATPNAYQQALPAVPLQQMAPGVSLGSISSGQTPAAAGSAGGYPAINPGEDPMAYMLRIGMSAADAGRARAMALANPGMSFQDIMAAMQSGGGGAAAGGVGSGTGGGVGAGGVTDPTAANPAGATGGVNGVPGYGGTFNLSNWQDPGYDFRLAQGMKALQGSAAASGGLLSGPTLKAITNYSQDAASQEYQNAFNRFMANRQFNYGVDTGDRAFDYATRTGDQAYNLQLAQALANMGQYGTSGAAGTNNLIATLLNQNALTAGQVAGQGTIGGGNAINNAISQALSQYLGQNYLNRVLPQPAQG